MVVCYAPYLPPFMRFDAVPKEQPLVELSQRARYSAGNRDSAGERPDMDEAC